MSHHVTKIFCVFLFLFFKNPPPPHTHIHTDTQTHTHKHTHKQNDVGGGKRALIGAGIGAGLNPSAGIGAGFTPKCGDRGGDRGGFYTPVRGWGGEDCLVNERERRWKTGLAVVMTVYVI